MFLSSIGQILEDIVVPKGDEEKGDQHAVGADATEASKRLMSAVNASEQQNELLATASDNAQEQREVREEARLLDDDANRCAEDNLDEPQEDCEDEKKERS